MAGCAAASKLTDGLKRLSQSHAHRNARLLRLKCQWRKDVLDADRADSEVLVLAHRLIGACQLYLGNFGETRRHCEARSEEHTSELQSLMRISYAVFCLKKKTKHIQIRCTRI